MKCFSDKKRGRHRDRETRETETETRETETERERQRDTRKIRERDGEIDERLIGMEVDDREDRQEGDIQERI